jgi:uncharacterized membrane protein (GlpM family)
MQEIIYRFIVGGLTVSLFAVIGDVLKPKSFAGLFGAAPSVALATLSLAIVADGRAYAALEARSMIVGATAFLFYACLCARLMKKHGLHAASATIGGLAAWTICALGIWMLVLR